MAIETAQLDRLMLLLDSLADGTSPLAGVRQVFPHWVVSQCDATDLRDEQPVCSSRRYDVHLVDSREQCWRMTDVAEQATGVILARREWV